MKFSVQTRRKIMVGSALFVCTAIPSFAILGVGDVVFDPTNWAETAAAAISAATTLETMQANLKNFSVKQLWQTAEGALAKDNVQNRFGETNGLNTALNTDAPDAATTAWNTANVAVDPDAGAALQGQTPGNSAALAQLAMVEASDSISPNCLNAIGQYRSQRTQNANAQTSLEDQQLDTSADTNSEIEQLNLLNASEAQKMTEMQSQGAIQTCLAAQATVANMQQRNAAAQALNDASFAQQEHQNNPLMATNESDTWATYVP